MIIRSRPKLAPIALGPRGNRGFVRLLEPDDFRFEIAREISRSNRRGDEREFSLLIFRQIVADDRGKTVSAVMQDICSRIRISDSIGWLDSKLTLLLPETDLEGAKVLANELASTIQDERLADNEIYVFPWDDDLLALADELRSEFERHRDDSENNLDRDDSSDDCQFETVSQPAHSIAKQSPASRSADRAVHFTQCLPTPWWKRSIDIACAATGLALLSPVFLISSLAIKLTSSGPIFFVQAREGRDGEPFGIIKFRTMIQNAEQKQHELRDLSEQDGPAFKIKDDPRLTPVGRYLRRSCVDELPQLLNVLKGDMSLVGPRPLPVGESHRCTAWQRARLTVLPGLTCTWQARGGRDTKFEEWMRMDLDYIRNRSLWLDLKLIFETAFLALLHRGSV
jgi:lipopolysaccharide/colanic/teichoic acid biosynthesis glycosyltransferase